MNVEQMPDTFVSTPTLAFRGPSDPLAVRIMAIAEREATKARITPSEAAVMMANSVMPGRAK